jgi:hypothetical protein
LRTAGLGAPGLLTADVLTAEVLTVGVLTGDVESGWRVVAPGVAGTPILVLPDGVTEAAATGSRAAEEAQPSTPASSVAEASQRTAVAR